MPRSSAKGTSSSDTASLRLFDDVPVRFGPDFLADHAGQIITNPRVALIELVSNSYDAGATDVAIEWPDGESRDNFGISDNGHGMSRAEFDERWRTLNYKRAISQGAEVSFPAGVSARHRTALGLHGKGRHGAFFFADEYDIETWRDRECTSCTVRRTNGGKEPFHFEFRPRTARDGHGTAIRVKSPRTGLSVDAVRETIGTTFIVDPDFRVRVNGEIVALEDLTSISEYSVDVPPHGKLTIFLIDPGQKNRTTHLKGITFWVNGKRVGESSWSGLDREGSLLDGRSKEAKSYAFIVLADMLKDSVKDNWSGFHRNLKTNAVFDAVRDFVNKSLRGLLSDSRRERKRRAVAENRIIIKSLPDESKTIIGSFIDGLLENCPSLGEGDLQKTVEILAKLEKTRSGYDLLNQLHRNTPDDLDAWNDIMSRWSARGAQIVLNELDRRLTLINDLSKLVHDRKTDELHELHPLFEDGLWIFGPEYERVDFRSNRGMTEIVRRFLKVDSEAQPSRRRADLIALPDSSIGIYSSDGYDDAGEVSGVDKALIVELKRGGSTLTQKELDQGRDYALELRKHGALMSGSSAIVFVLGEKLDEGISEDARFTSAGVEIRVLPLTYDTVLRRAHARTFHLQQRLHAAGAETATDEDVLRGLAVSQSDLEFEPSDHVGEPVSWEPVE
jgi:hypothetical protein